MPLYESTFIARPDISSQQVDGLAEQFREILTEAGGEVAKTEYWGLRSLAYRIKKNRKGHYYFMNIDAPAEAINAMERTMRINEDVIRYLTVRVEEHDPNPAPLTQSRGRGRDGRGGRGGRWEGRGEGRRREDGEE
ncbi:MAG: 30S ribosomal protein S6, partial [Rhodospirillales bacterium]|nr:30S ribosomal protein S6 [Rhodospirillales bacterium]